MAKKIKKRKKDLTEYTFDEVYEFAERGDVEAQSRIGNCYREGVGVTSNLRLSFEWTQLAAIQGNAEAKYCLGSMLENEQKMGSEIQIKHFQTYEEVSEYCYPFEKNLEKGILEEQKIALLEGIARAYHQQLEKISQILGCPDTILVHVSNSSSYWGKCWYKERIIELDVTLICHHPLVLTEVIIHELTHYEHPNHRNLFYDCMRKNVEKLGLQSQLYGSNPNEKYPLSVQRLYLEQKRLNRVRKLLKLQMNKKSIIHSIPDFSSYQELSDLCVPYYKCLIQITGVLDRIKIISYAEQYYKEVLFSLAQRLNIRLDEVYISDVGNVIPKSHTIKLPSWLISLPVSTINVLLVRYLTQLQYPCNNEVEFQNNLSKLGIKPQLNSTIFTICGFNSWKKHFDESGRIITNPEPELKPKPKQRKRLPKQLKIQFPE